MARGKHATALFEVIHTAKKPPKASPTGGGIPAPKWWAKGGRAADRAPAGHAASAEEDAEPTPEPSGGTRRSWLSAARPPSPAPAADEVDSPNESASEEVSPDERPAEAGRAQVFITRIYPPNAPEPRADGPESTDGPESGDAGPDAAPVFTRPPAQVIEPDLTEERLTWAARRARVLAERAAGPSDATFDPTADVSAADLRSPRPRQWAAADEEPPPAPRPPRTPRRSAGPTPSALKADVDPAVSLDRAAGEVRVRLSYAGAVFAALIVLLVVVIAFLVGQHAGAGGESAADLSSGTQTSPPAAVAAAPTPASGMMAAVSTTAPSAVEPPAAAAAEPAPVATATEPPARKVGMIYIVMQSYPDRETARRAGEFLNRSGVPCTVIPGLSGFALRDWFSVVGLQPIDRSARGPALQTYLRQLTALGPKFSGKAYNQFQPQPYTWRPDSDEPRP